MILLSYGFPSLLPFPSRKPDGFQSFAVVGMCVCVFAHACVRAHVLSNEERHPEGEKEFQALLL